jgi:hypothetical protein
VRFMRRFVLMIGLAVTGCARDSVPPASATVAAVPEFARVGGTGLVRHRLEGMRRVCTYRADPIGRREVTLRVGIAERCPDNYRPTESSLPPPPTAPLEESLVQDGSRTCVYALRENRWTFTVPLQTSCPLNAGMAEQFGVRAEQR